MMSKIFRKTVVATIACGGLYSLSALAATQTPTPAQLISSLESDGYFRIKAGTKLIQQALAEIDSSKKTTDYLNARASFQSAGDDYLKLVPLLTDSVKQRATLLMGAAAYDEAATCYARTSGTDSININSRDACLMQVAGIDANNNLSLAKAAQQAAVSGTDPFLAGHGFMSAGDYYTAAANAYIVSSKTSVKGVWSYKSINRTMENGAKSALTEAVKCYQSALDSYCVSSHITYVKKASGSLNTASSFLDFVLTPNALVADNNSLKQSVSDPDGPAGMYEVNWWDVYNGPDNSFYYYGRRDMSKFPNEEVGNRWWKFCSNLDQNTDVQGFYLFQPELLPNLVAWSKLQKYVKWLQVNQITFQYPWGMYGYHSLSEPADHPWGVYYGPQVH